MTSLWARAGDARDLQSGNEDAGRRNHRPGRTERAVAFVDGAVADLAAIAPLVAPACEVVRIERGCDPLEVIADAMAARPGVRALHVFCHGEPGALRFGDSRLDLEALRRGAGRLARIGAALEGGDILLYGCRVGAEAAGRDFVGHLSALTGTSVAAATGLVGAAALGGNWALSEVRGTPRTAPIALPAFDGVLASGILQNRYVRFGYSDDGTLGYGGITRPGIQYDPDGTRNFLDTADSLTPGTPFEGFTLAIGGTRYAENNAVYDGAAINGTHIVSTDLTTEGADTWGSVTYVTEVGGLRITQTLILDGVDAKAITVSVTVENISASAIGDVTYARYLDPDVDSNGLPGSTSSTGNVRGAGDIAPEDVVLATGPVSGRVIGYYSDSSVAHNTSVSSGWSTVPADYLSGTDGSGSADDVIGIGFDVGDLAAGAAVAFTFDVIFAASIEELNESIPNAAPVLGGPASPIAAPEQEATLVAPALTVSDADDTTLASATVAITSGFVAGEDTLAFANAAGMGNITGTYDGATGVLSLSSAGATATLAEWQAALRAVTYANLSDTPETADRTLSIVANDALVPSAAFTATISVSVVNDAPTGTPATDLPDGTAGTAYAIAAADLLAGFTDPDGGPLSVAGLSASAGTLVDNGDGTWTLATASDFNGTVTLSYAVSDSDGGTLPGQTRALDFAPTAAIPPTAVPDTFTLAQNAPGIALDVLANDEGGDPASRRITHINDVAVAVGQMVAVAGGTLLLSVAGGIVFTPAAGFTGDVAFTYSFTDATGGASTGAVTGSVTRLDDLPRAAADHFTLPADGSPVTIDGVANDSHPGGGGLTITQVEGRAIAAGESVSVRGGEVLLDEHNALVFTADPDFSGPVSFTYTAVDSQGRAAEAIVTTTSAMAALAPELEATLTAAGLPRVSNLDDLLAIASVVVPGAFSALGAGLGQGYSAGPGTDLDLDSATTDADLMMQALLAIVGVQTSGTGQKVLTADASGAWTSAIDQSLLFQSVLSSDSDVKLAFGADGADFASPGSSMGAWSRSFAQQMLSPDVPADYVTQADRQSQALSHQSDVTAGSLLSVDIAGQSAGTPQAALSNLYGFVDFVSSDGQSAVEVSRTVMVAQTAGAGDQTATVTLRQTGMNDAEVAFYRVDDYSGTVDGLRPGEAGYDAASTARAYQTSGGDAWIAGGGYGALSTAELVGINSGDLIVMRLRSEGSDFYAFAQANEVANGEHVNHLWNYGLNTWGWEDLHGGGDQDFNDLVVRLDFVPSPDGLAG